MQSPPPWPSPPSSPSAQQEAEAAWQAERVAAIAAIADRNYAEARRGGSHFIFEGIPAKYR